MHKTEFVLVRNATQDAAGILRDDFRLLSGDIDDLQSVRFPSTKNEKSKGVIVDPEVIADGFCLFENQRWRSTCQRKFPEALRTVSFYAHDRNILSVGHQRRRVLTLRRVGDLNCLAAVKVITKDVRLLVSDRGVKNAAAVRQE